MSARLRAGIVGSGFMATVHARAIHRAGADLVAVATRSGDRSAADRLGAGKVHPSLDGLLNDDVDVVHVCTPNALHEQQALQVLGAGINVICEKPLATSAAAAANMASAAASADLVAAVPFVYRFYGPIRQMRQFLGGGQQLTHIRGTYLQDWLGKSDDTNWRVNAGEAGASRAFGDIGVHWADLAEFVTGQRIVTLVAQMKTVITSRPGIERVETEDLAAVLFETDRGVAGQLAVSQVSWGRTNRLQLDVDGRDTSYSFCSERQEELWSATPEGVRVTPRGRSPHPDVNRFDRVPSGHPQGYQDCFDAFVSDTYTAVLAKSAPDGLPTFADGARAALITQAVVQSAKTGGWVTIG